MEEKKTTKFDVKAVIAKAKSTIQNAVKNPAVATTAAVVTSAVVGFLAGRKFEQKKAEKEVI